MRKFSFWGGCLFLLLTYKVVIAAEQTLIPEPLTLQYALSQSTLSVSPEIMSYSAQRQIAVAEQELAVSDEGIYVYINGRLRYVEPASFLPSDETNDSKISLNISKRLYDFGQTSAKIDASKEKLASVEALYADFVSKRTVSILQAYLNVILADIIFDHADQAMAIAYIRYDKMKSRFELQQVSDIELLEVENSFRETRRDRAQAESDQRLTRQRLAQLISPGNLSEKLELPELENIHALSTKRELKEFETLLEIAKSNNPRLIALAHKLESSKLKRDGTQAERYPVISAHLQAADYARELGSSDKFRAGIEVTVPLYQAGQENAKIKRINGEIIELEAEKIRISQDVEQQVLTLWLKISNLKQQYSDPDLTLDYRDLYLERSRALYELEVTSDLGDAMVKLTNAQLFKAQTQFELAISWAKLDALLGNPLNYYEQQGSK